MCRAYRPRLRSYFRRHGLEAGSTEDAAQETLRRALEALASKRIREGRVEGWLFSTARHVLVDILRERRRSAQTNQTLDDLAADDDAASRAELEEQRALLKGAVDALPARYREVIRLRHCSELGYREISERVGISVGAVGVRLYRARRMLQRRLAGRIPYG
jgi:RNA polymerase sigma-70 factor (ECF subfamily)